MFMSFTAEALQQVLIAAVQPADPSVLQRVDEQLAAWETESVSYTHLRAHET